MNYRIEYKYKTIKIIEKFRISCILHSVRPNGWKGGREEGSIWLCKLILGYRAKDSINKASCHMLELENDLQIIWKFINKNPNVAVINWCKKYKYPIHSAYLLL